MRIVDFVTIFKYFYREFRLFYFSLICLAVFIAFCEGLNITLLYPIISAGLGIDSDLSSFPFFVKIIARIFPVKSEFIGLILIFLILTALLMIIQLVYWKLSYKFTQCLTLSLKHELYSKLLHSDYRLFQNKKQGEIINLVNTGPTIITNVFEIVMNLISDMSISIIILVSLFLISPIGLFIVLVGIGLYYVINNLISKNASIQLGKLDFSSQQSETVLVNEYITGVKAIIAANREKKWEERILEKVHIFWDNYPQYRFLQRMPGLMIYSLFLFAIGFFVLIFATYQPNSLSTIIPIFGTFIVGLLRILPKASSIGINYMQIIQSVPYYSAVYCFLHDKQYDVIIDGNRTFKSLEGDIIFENISFSYDNIHVIRNLSFSIRKGEITAIVGPSGAGKSTLVNLLLRLYDPNSGRILINGINLKDFDIGSFRDNIGYVSQEPFVFNSSIRENITFGGNYDYDDITHASTLAHANSFISNLPMKYDTIIGDHGIKLSGGEKQRIVLARAMIRKPEILILDEATSSLDNISESIVQEAIDDASKGCTTIVIAHRLTTIQNADKILVLDNGSFIEEGTHEQLMQKMGLYWKMFTKSEND